MPDIEIKQLYNLNRFPDSPQKICFFVIYLPLGIVLTVLRTLLGILIFIVGHILPDAHIIRNVLSRLLCFTFGVVVTVENPDKREDVEAFISNQISIFDHLVVHSATDSVTPGVKLNSLLSSIFGIQSFGSASNFENFKSNIMAVIAKNKGPLYFQPESIITNGRAIIKFNSWPFSVCTKIQPVAIKVSRPLLDIFVTTAEASYWTNFFFYLFSPCTVYTLHFLPAREKKGTTDAEFAEKIRQDVASALKIETVDYTASDLKEWQKRYRLEQQQLRSVQAVNSNNSVNPEIHRMTIQVREVLPHVPYNVIYKDLVKTRNVDVTITNILEGHVPFTPESSQSSGISKSSQNVPSTFTSSNQPSTSAQNISRDISNMAAGTFGKSAQERTSSYQERKKLLIENARKRYIEKHGLNNLVLNNC